MDSIGDNNATELIDVLEEEYEKINGVEYESDAP
jgi:hypothetical protein